MTNPLTIVVPVKYVPDAQKERSLGGESPTLDRSEGILSELDEYALEAALQLFEARGGSSAGHRILALTVGPEQAATATKRALQMGADAAYHVLDDALAGSDAWVTSHVLTAAVEKIAVAEERPVDLVLTGMASTDGETSLVPAQLSERLGYCHVGFAGSLELTEDCTELTATLGADGELLEVSATLPAVVSVTDQINTPRYPNFKAIMAAKKKPVQTWTVEELRLDTAQVGRAGSLTEPVEATARPPRSAGETITDEGEGGVRLAEFLIAEKLV